MGSLFSRLCERLIPSQVSLTGGMSDNTTQRRTDINKWWTYYHGSDPITGNTQWSYLYQRFNTMPHREIEDIENHTRICTDRLKRLLVNSWRGIETNHDQAGNAIRSVLSNNNWAHLLSLIVLSGKVTGDAFIKLSPVSSNSLYGPIRLTLLDTAAVEVEVSPHDRNAIQKLTVTYDFFDRDENDRMIKHNYREIIDNTSVTGFVDDTYAPEFSYDHDLGFLPVVHVRNRDTGGGIYGESLVSRLLEAQDALNLLTTDLMDIVRYDGHKTTIFQNVAIDRGASRDGQTSGEVDLSIGKGLVVKGDGRVYKLEQQHDLGAALQEYDRKVDVFYDLAGVPRLSRELMSHFSTLSGRAIERLYHDAIESTREAQTLYGESFCDLGRKIGAMLGYRDVSIETLWNTDVIKPDIETLEREYALGARSKRSVMRKLGIAEIDRMIEEIASDNTT